MDKHQAEGIANAMLARERAVRDIRRSAFGRNPYERGKRGLMSVWFACILIGAAGGAVTHHWLPGGWGRASSFLMITEFGAMLGVMAALLFTSWRSFRKARARQRASQERFEQALAARR